jgi:hypothetical protein
MASKAGGWSQAKAADIPRQCWFCANGAMNGWQAGKLALQPAHSPWGSLDDYTTDSAD